MAIEIIDLGTVAQDGADGDVAREAFEKVNANFAEHESEIDALVPRVTTIENEVGQLEIQAGQIQGDLTNLTESFNILSSEVGSNSADIQNLENSREYTLVPGEGITIDRTNPSSPIISSTGSSGSVWGQITGNLSDQIDLQNALNGKVDKVEGKQLSTEDFTTDDKQRLQESLLTNDFTEFKSELASDEGANLVGYRGRNVYQVLDQVVNIKDAPFSVTGDNTDDDRTRLIAALDYAASVGKPVVVPPGVYEFNNWIPFPDKMKLVFMPGAVWKLTATTSLGGFVCGGYTEALERRPFTDADIYGIELDTNNIPGENSFNAINAVGVRVHNPKLRNIRISSTTQGGKAFQFEGDVVDGIQIYSPVIENATIGINSHADPKGGAEIARNISYYDVVMRNVDVPFNCDGQFADPESGTLANMNTTVFGVQLFNCGRLSYPTSDPLGAGIVCGDRGMGLNISGLRVFNEDSYGAIGALVRGSLFDLRLRDFVFNGPQVRHLIDLSPVTYGQASTGTHVCRIDAQIEAICKIDKLLNGYSAGKVGVSTFDLLIDSAKSQLVAITDAQGAYNGLGQMRITLKNVDRQTTGLQSLNSLLLNGNTLSQCQPQHLEGAFTPIDGSQDGLTLNATNSYYMRNGRRTYLTFMVEYPSTTSTNQAKIGGLPFTAFKNAGAVFAYKGSAEAGLGLLRAGSTTLEIFTAGGAPAPNSQLSGQIIYITLDYLST